MTLGDLDIASSSESQTLQTLATAIAHPRYNSTTKENDVALLKLETPVDFSAYPHIRPLCLSPDVHPVTGAKLVIAGWGHTEGSESAVSRGASDLACVVRHGLSFSGDSGNSGKLLEATTYVISQESCRDNFGPNINENFICTQSAGKNICFVRMNKRTERTTARN